MFMRFVTLLRFKNLLAGGELDDGLWTLDFGLWTLDLPSTTTSGKLHTTSGNR